MNESGKKLRVLMLINSGRMGGLERHVHCLAKCLDGVASVRVCAVSAGPATDAMAADGVAVDVLGGASGHDLRIVGPFLRVMRSFRPDVVHVHSGCFLPVLLLWLFPHVRVVCSIHTPTGVLCFKQRLLETLCRRPDYFLPVSQSTWDAFRRFHPDAQGEVFYNPVRLSAWDATPNVKCQTSNVPVIGMVGRNAPEKDWPTFHGVERVVTARRSDASFFNGGEHEICDGVAAIRRMTAYLVTSRSEEMPTAVLECFAAGTPVCGFIPEGGMAEILAFSAGPLREVFLAERDCAKLAAIVERVLDDAELRAALVADGRQIVEKHFAAEKNCRGQLRDVYRRVTQ